MFYVAMDRLKDSHLAEDAIHNTFLRVLKYINEESIEDVKNNKDVQK